jgi:hypothetical protein
MCAIMQDALFICNLHQEPNIRGQVSVVGRVLKRNYPFMHITVCFLFVCCCFFFCLIRILCAIAE